MHSDIILLLGGYGGVGRTMARLILKELPVNVIIAGRRKDKADEFAALLNKEFTGNRAESRYADVADKKCMTEAFRGVKLVLVLTTTPDAVKNIAEASLEAGCDYMDILVSESAVLDLEEFKDKIAKKGRTFITQAGFHPGLPAVFIRYGAQFFDKYEKAIIGMAMNARFERAEQAAEFIPLISESNTDIFKNGKWKKATYKDAVSLNMGEKFGKQLLFPLQMREILTMPEKYGLTDTGVYVSGFNWFVDNFVFPLIFVIQKIKKGLWVQSLQKLFVWGVNKYSSPYQGVFFLNEAEGLKNNKKIKVRIVAESDDAYSFTAIPVVACLRQYLNRKIEPGLCLMGQAVDESELMTDLKKLGVNISALATEL